MNSTAPPPRKPEPRPPGERRSDSVTLILAVALAIIALGAIGYGIFNSARVATAIPSVVTTGRGTR